MKIKLYIGLDVHKNSVVVAIAKADGSAPEHYGKWGGTNLCSQRGLAKLCQKFGLQKHEVRIVYEAGPTGFVLARRLLQLGYDCIVVAPSEVPGKNGERVKKTDKRDARKLARLLRAGELDPIHIPEPQDEAVRDLCRARTDASEALARSKQQLGMFLLRNGVAYSGKTNWTQAHMNYLRQLRLSHPAQQIVLEEYLQAIDDGVERVARIEAHMEQVLEAWERKPYVEALMAFRGFKTVAAMTTVSELGDLSRFTRPPQLMGYLGMVSEESSSGEKRRQGGIWLSRSPRGFGLRPAFGRPCRLRPSAPFQDRQRACPVDAHRVWFALQSFAARLAAAIGPAERSEQRGAGNRLAGAEPAQRPLPTPGRAGIASQQDHRRHRAGTLRLPLGVAPPGQPGDLGQELPRMNRTLHSDQARIRHNSLRSVPRPRDTYSVSALICIAHPVEGSQGRL